jgi:hypothetical protein
MKDKRCKWEEEWMISIKSSRQGTCSLFIMDVQKYQVTLYHDPSKGERLFPLYFCSFAIVVALLLLTSLIVWYIWNSISFHDDYPKSSSTTSTVKFGKGVEDSKCSIDANCGMDLYCSQEGVCKVGERRPEWATCDEQRPCSKGFHCTGEAQVCRDSAIADNALKSEGEQCVDYYDCGVGMECRRAIMADEFGTCTKKDQEVFESDFDNFVPVYRKYWRSNGQLLDQFEKPKEEEAWPSSAPSYWGLKEPREGTVAIWSWYNPMIGQGSRVLSTSSSSPFPFGMEYDEESNWTKENGGAAVFYLLDPSFMGTLKNIVPVYILRNLETTVDEYYWTTAAGTYFLETGSDSYSIRSNSTTLGERFPLTADPDTNTGILGLGFLPVF